MHNNVVCNANGDKMWLFIPFFMNYQTGWQMLLFITLITFVEWLFLLNIFVHIIMRIMFSFIRECYITISMVLSVIKEPLEMVFINILASIIWLQKWWYEILMYFIRSFNYGILVNLIEFKLFLNALHLTLFFS